MATPTKINVIIPAFNEQDRLRETIESYNETFISKSGEKSPKEIEMQKARALFTDNDMQLIIVDDGSKDSTAKIAKELVEQLDIPSKIFTYKPNKGKGYAVRFGVLNSRPADFYYLADSDLSAQWTVLPRLLTEMVNEEYDCVIGSRNLPESEVEDDYRRFMGKISNIVINLVLSLDVKDTQCGYKLFNSMCIPAFKMQKLQRFGFDFEILYILKHVLGLRVKEVGIRWADKAGSKVKLKDYVRTLRELFKVRTGHYEIEV